MLVVAFKILFFCVCDLNELFRFFKYFICVSFRFKAFNLNSKSHEQEFDKLKYKSNKPWALKMKRGQICSTVCPPIKRPCHRTIK